jgi:major membrane immunogen (membrane-anchored lipoprotein)
MNKMTFVIAISSLLVLAACGKSSDVDSSETTAAPTSMNETSESTLSEQATTTDQAREAGSETMEQANQAAFEMETGKSEESGNTIGNTSGETTESTGE